MSHSTHPTNKRRPRILIGVSGSVATIKLPLLAQSLLPFADIKIVASSAAMHFLTPSSCSSLLPPECLPILTDQQDWAAWKEVGDDVLHIELRRWADVLLIAPLSANTLAKCANGMCDNLLTCVMRAWDWRRDGDGEGEGRKGVLVAPAMNTMMWTSPFTVKHLGVLEELGVVVLHPVEKKLACGDVGAGGMAAVEDIVDKVKEMLKELGR
jgi:phosphopantothenoylcysteine decarboxylase